MKESDWHAVEVGSGKKVKLTSDVSEEQAVMEVCDGDKESVDEESEKEEEPLLVEELVARQEVVKLWEDTEEEKLGPTGLVRLLSATKIPSGFKKMIRAKIEGDVWEDLSLFTPCSLESDLAMPDSVFERKDGPCVVLIVENHSTKAVRLEKGQLLGGVVPVAEVSVEEAVDEESGCEELGGVTEESVCALAGEREAGRTVRLLDQLDLHGDHLTSEQRHELVDLVASYADVFALEPGELGTTNVVTHTIDTGRFVSQ